MELKIEAFFGQGSVPRVPEREDAALIEGDDEVARGVVDNADDGPFVIAEGEARRGRVERIDVDRVGFRVAHGAQRARIAATPRSHVLVELPCTQQSGPGA